MQIKVADFGTCKVFKGQGASPLRTMIGTTDYCAPEVENNTDHQEYDGPAADIFSCGIILFVLLTGKFPYQEVEDKMHKDFLWAPA
jgi:serine/threonine protein kinase